MGTNRTIESPGVEIKERDLSFNTQTANGTTSMVVGFTKQGPTDELINVTNVGELDQIYGTPETAAEKYTYYTAKQILNARGNLLVTRMPYGSGNGAGYASKYSALVYPVIPVDVSTPRDTYGTYTAPQLFNDVQVTSISNTYGDGSIESSPFTIAAALTGDVVYLSDSDVGTFKAECLFTNVTGATGNVIASTSNTFTFDASGSVIAASSIASLSATSLSAAKWFGKLDISDLLSKSSIIAQENLSNENAYVVTLSAVNDAAAITSANITMSVSGNGFTSNPSEVSLTTASHYFIGEPIHITIDDNTYSTWQQGGINWSDTVSVASLSTFANSTDQAEVMANIGHSGIVIVNEAKPTMTDQYEGYYVAIADNSKCDKGSSFDSISNVKSFDKATASTDWNVVNGKTLSFTMTGSYFEHSGSVSEVVESIPTFDFSSNKAGGFGDSIVLTLFRLRPSIYNDDSRVLDSVLFESYIGSLDSSRQVQDSNGGASVNFYLEDVVNKSNGNLKVFVNPSISKYSGLWIDPQTQEPTKFVRVKCGARSILGSSTTDVIGTADAEPHNSAKYILDNIDVDGYMATADSLYGIGEPVSSIVSTDKYIGNLPYKLERALSLAENKELIRLDIIPEGGLGTIWTNMNLDYSNWSTSTKSYSSSSRIRDIFDDTVYINGITTAHRFDKNTEGLLDYSNGSSSFAATLYNSISNLFKQFCANTRKDCLYIADPLRNIFVQGAGDVKVLEDRRNNFSQHIFYPLKNLFGGLDSSYVCAYANWLKINDVAGDRFIWAPASGYIANAMIQTDSDYFPWYAPAGLTRGLLTGVVDIGINPTDKQRDLLYKNGINPIVYWPSSGYVVWGQKTLQKKPSAFDRINVRRLFLWAEKSVLQIAKYFVFENNTVFTRGRLVAAIDPILSYAKSNDGIYDYLIICDKSNNDDSVIDRNEMIADIYIKPTRTSEYILVNFVATRTGQNLEELV